MRQKETQNKSDGELYYTIENGIRLSGMPAFGEEHAEAGDMETWNLVLFIRHLPNQTAEDIQRGLARRRQRPSQWLRSSYRPLIGQRFTVLCISVLVRGSACCARWGA